MTSIAERFADAQVQIRTKTTLGNAAQLELYGLFKQATVGDATGTRPGMLDIRGRAKFDAWAARRGLSKELAQQEYVTLVDTLLANS